MRTLWGAQLAPEGDRALEIACRRGIPGFEGWRVVNGDESDLRHLEPAPCIVALKAKGRAARDTSEDVNLSVLYFKRPRVSLSDPSAEIKTWVFFQ
jgi:hypothetical protein